MGPCARARRMPSPRRGASTTSGWMSLACRNRRDSLEPHGPRGRGRPAVGRSVWVFPLREAPAGATVARAAPRFPRSQRPRVGNHAVIDGCLARRVAAVTEAGVGATSSNLPQQVEYLLGRAHEVAWRHLPHRPRPSSSGLPLRPIEDRGGVHPASSLADSSTWCDSSTCRTRRQRSSPSVSGGSRGRANRASVSRGAPRYALPRLVDHATEPHFSASDGDSASNSPSSMASATSRSPSP